TGAINIPGTYEFKTGDKVYDLLKKAQGTAINAYLSLAYIIRQKDEMTKKYISFNLKNVINNSNSPDNILLQKYDTLKILSNSDFLDNYKITIYGSVRKPGDYFYGENLSLRDAILLAGGLKQEAATNRIEISRIIDYNEKNNIITPQRAIVFSTQVNVDLTLNEQSNTFQLQPFDLVFIRENPDFEIPKTVILIGEVTYPGVYSLVKKDETVASLIKRAGGLSQYAYVDGVTMNRKFEETGLVYINLAKALKREHSKYNIVLNDSDEIYIPKVIDLVRISGAIGNVNFKSISAPYFGNKRAKYYIKNFAGGFNKDCEKAKTFVIYPNGIMKKTKNFGLIRFYPKVRNGSNVHLSFKEVKPDDKAQKAPVDWNKIIENTTIKITGLLTLWLLVTKIQ
ncbi:MAG: SLBB domain-containing protein, partial [Bacteroidales bacterium]|nr:SLBB domain-containing protein [Bacteroidales bacterium]